MIQLTLVGNIGNDAVTKVVGTTTVTEFPFACKGAKKEDKPTWVKCAIWGERGTKVQPYLTKGTSLVIFGRLAKNEVYENKNKEWVAALNVTVSEFSFAGSTTQSSEQTAPANTQSTDNQDDLPF